MKLFTILLTIICVLGYAMYAEGRLGSPAEIQRRRLKTYSYGGTTYNAGGYKANPSRSAQIEARNAGALTNSEARSMGLKNYRDEMVDDEFVGRPGFIGSTFRHAVNNQRPEVQRANRNGVIKGLQSTFQHPGDIPLTKKDAFVKTLEFGSKMHQHGYGSKGMGNWRRDEMVDDEFVGRPSYTQGNGRTYQSNGYTMNSKGYLANPSRSAQIQARNAGALTNSEARSMGLKNYRDEMDEDESVGWRGAAIKYGPQAINAVRTWGPVIKHCVSSMCGGDEMADDINDESVGYGKIRTANWRL